MTKQFNNNLKIKIMRNINNRVQLIGNLGMNPEIKSLESGKTMAKLSIATSDSYISKDGEIIKTTQWHNIIAWNKQAELAEKYLSKGQQVCVAGKLNNRSYEDKDGNKQYITEVIVDNFMFLRN
jgi:single-strand DNA-binding protein